MSHSKLLSLLPFSEKLEDLTAKCVDLWPQTRTGQALVMGVVAGLAAYLLMKKRYNLPPGPRGWPLVGNLLDLGNKDLHKLLAEWQKIYGPVFTFKMGPEQIVALNRIDVVLEALVKRQADFAGRPRSYTTDIFSDGGKSIAMGDYNATWKLHRRLASKALRYYMMGSRLEQSIERSLSKTIELIKEKKGTPVDPHDYITLSVFNIIFHMCFFKTVGITDTRFTDLIHMFDAVNEVFGNGLLEDVIPPLRLIKTKKCRMLVDFAKKFRQYLNTEIDEHRDSRSKSEKENVRDFCDAVLLAQEEAKAEEDPEMLAKITDAHVTQTMSDIFGAGLDTSRFTLLWALLYLAAYPDIQDKVHQEVDQALGSRQYPTLSDRSQLTYTEAVLHETLRLNVITTIAIHKTICDSKIGNYDIPEGTSVFINLYGIHHDPENWNQPEVFRPERFLDSSGKMAPKPASWLPFSIGRRACLGEPFAKPELQLLLAGIMRHFKISLPPGEKANFETGGGSFAYIPKRYKLIMTPKL